MSKTRVPLDKDGYRILTKEQRLRVYARALETFKKHAKEVIEQNLIQCNGMCKHVDRAVSYLRYDRHHTVKASNSRESREAWPEYKSFEPKTGWKENTGFWLTRNVRAGGHTKRIAILEACAAGKKKGE